MKLWRENRLDQEYEATELELAERYEASEWADPAGTGWPFERRFYAWLCSTEQATVDQPDAERLMDFILDRRS